MPSIPALRAPLLSTAACLAALTTAPNTPAAADAIPSVDATPIVRLDADRLIAACGVGLTTTLRDHEIAAELVLEKTSEKPEFRFTARASDATPLADASLTTPSSATATLMPKPAPSADGAVTSRAAIPGLDGSELVRSLMVSGATLRIVFADGTAAEAALGGPLPHAIRAGYLNCAGDLVRP